MLSLNIKKLVEKYGNLILKNEKMRKKFNFVQKSRNKGSKEDIAKSFEYIYQIEFELQSYICEKGDFILNQAKSKLKHFENKYSYLVENVEVIKEKIKFFNNAVNKKQYGIIISALDYITAFEKNPLKYKLIELNDFSGKLYNELYIINEEDRILKNSYSYNLEKLEESLKNIKLISENFDTKPSSSSKVSDHRQSRWLDRL